LRLPALFALGLAGLRLCFYAKIRRQIFTQPVPLTDLRTEK
jgi:hypothetical protein